jgi:hypothetical protein
LLLLHDDEDVFKWIRATMPLIFYFPGGGGGGGAGKSKRCDHPSTAPRSTAAASETPYCPATITCRRLDSFSSGYVCTYFYMVQR